MKLHLNGFSIPSTIFGMPWHELKLLKWKQEETKPTAATEKPKMSTATMALTLENVAEQVGYKLDRCNEELNTS